jgi:energy-coupling factor transporter transmembrane protein EcfT
LIFPLSIRQLWRPRRLAMMMLLVLPPILWGEPDMVVRGIPISGAGLLLGLQMLLRAIVILVAVNGLTNTVDISSLAGVFERLGLHGLGFSIGVALNLLPSLQQSSLNAWRSLKMRGGLRRQRRHSLQLLAMTIVTNALRRAEEVALAAEARAFSPQCCRALPIKTGLLDWVIILVGSLILFVFTIFA